MSVNSVIYFNGKWIGANQTLIDSLRPGILRGEGVFETMLCDDRQIYLWEEHYKRFQRGFKAFKLKSPATKKQLHQWLIDCIKQNKIKNGRIRLAYYKDHGEKFIVIIVQPLKTSSKVKKNFKLCLSSRVRPNSKWSHLKTVSYQPFFDAHQEALTNGFDEALLLNKNKYIVEGSTTNIFFLKRNTLHTPQIKSGCLNGIVRGVVLKLAKLNGYKTAVGNYRLSQLLKADGVFVTNSTKGIQPVHQIDQTRLKNHPNGAVTALLNAYLKLLKN